MLQSVAECCRVLQCALQCIAVHYRVLQGVAVCCSVLQCVAVCCSVLQCVAASKDTRILPIDVQKRTGITRIIFEVCQDCLRQHVVIISFLICVCEYRRVSGRGYVCLSYARVKDRKCEYMCVCMRGYVCVRVCVCVCMCVCERESERKRESLLCWMGVSTACGSTES